MPGGGFFGPAGFGFGFGFAFADFVASSAGAVATTGGAFGSIGPIDDNDPKKFEKAVHLSSIHVDLGLQCVDCHYAQDAHGNGHIVGEVMAGVEIQCQDGHGTVDEYPSLSTSGPMAGPKGKQLALIRNPDGKKRFEWIMAS